VEPASTSPALRAPVRELALHSRSILAGYVSGVGVQPTVDMVDLRGLEPRRQSPCKGNPGALPEAQSCYQKYTNGLR
jgi:hypothetical protein